MRSKKNIDFYFYINDNYLKEEKLIGNNPFQYLLFIQ